MILVEVSPFILALGQNHWLYQHKFFKKIILLVFTVFFTFIIIYQYKLHYLRLRSNKIILFYFNIWNVNSFICHFITNSLLASRWWKINRLYPFTIHISLMLKRTGGFLGLCFACQFQIWYIIALLPPKVNWAKIVWCFVLVLPLS